MAESTKNFQKWEKKRKRRDRILTFLLIFLLLIIGSAQYKRQFAPMANNNIKEIIVDIPSGSSTSEIAGILKEKHLIRNKSLFMLRVKKSNFGGKLKAGIYTLNNGMDVDEIINNLAAGGKSENTVKFTIPEGYELKQIGRKLSELNLVDMEEFMALTADASRYWDKYPFLKDIQKGKSLEGFLYPDTYEVYKNSTEEQIIDKMLGKFQQVYDEKIKNNIESTGLSLNEVITLASIVEREGKVDEERPLIAAVFYNRLKKDMKLESCATVQYALGERKEKLNYDDIKIQSEYNTYIHKGLPPGPIASPGLKSIDSVLNPSNESYLFFVSKGDGTHVFSTNYKDFLKAKKEYLN